ncbi:VOC family protein [Streptomyces sp. LUP47B]|uniref:VOC family protein n=1 Tax=Streptomyces sp. LUP47B TaxID=1890286 RepID=UPI000A4D3879|nr:VOC family protein [Streptomyces sp. LUP47B]
MNPPQPQSSAHSMGSPLVAGLLHHVEVWVPDLQRAISEWGWLLEQIGYTPFQEWPDGCSWRLGTTYIVFEQSPALSASTHDRMRPGLNHLAFHVTDTATLDSLVGEAPHHGWTLLFPDEHPHAGGRHQHAAYLENSDKFEVELVAIPSTRGTEPHGTPES